MDVIGLMVLAVSVAMFVGLYTLFESHARADFISRMGWSAQPVPVDLPGGRVAELQAALDKLAATSLTVNREALALRTLLQDDDNSWRARTALFDFNLQALQDAIDATDDAMEAMEP